MTDQVERNEAETMELIEIFLPEDAQFEKEEIDEEEETRMLYYTSDQLAGIFEESSNYRTSENIDYREVKADLVPSGDNDEMYVGIVFSSH